MKFKIFKSFYITTACILFITLTLMFIVMSVAINGYITDSREEVLKKSVDTAAGFLDEGRTTSDFQGGIAAVAEINELKLMVSDHTGKIVFCSCDDFTANSSCADCDNAVDPAFLSEITAETDFSLSTMNGRYEDIIYLAAKKHYMPSGGVSYYIFSSASTVSVNSMLGTLFRTYAITAIIPLLFMFIAEYFLTYRLAKPLKYMSVAAKSIARGDFSNRVPVMSDDEIGELSVLFNRMSDSLSKNEMARRSFISNVSHELKTPMTTIGGFIDGMLDGTIDESRHEYYLKIVSEEVRRLTRLVSSMLTMTRLQSDEQALRPSRFDFAELLLSVVVSMEQKITDKQLDVRGFENLSHTEILADKDLIYQVVYNLVDNAIKYSSGGGFIEFTSHRIGDRLEFSVINSGVGILPEDLPYVFDRFYKADKSRSGNKDSLGLGLYITKTIVELHEGEISVQSEPDKTTAFTVSLPIKIH